MSKGTGPIGGIDHKYRAFLWQQPCAVCGKYGVDVAHTGSRIAARVGMGQKTRDRDAIPLCRREHEEYHRVGEKTWAEKYKVDLPAIRKALNAKYENSPWNTSDS